MVDALVLKLPTKLVVAKEKELLVQKINGETLTSESREIHNSLVALLVFAENFNFPFGWKDQGNSRGADEGVGGLGQALTRGKKRGKRETFLLMSQETEKKFLLALLFINRIKPEVIEYEFKYLNYLNNTEYKYE